MANTALAAGNRAEQWDNEFFEEYVRFSGFEPYMRDDMTAVICMKYELASGGETINIPLVNALTGPGVGVGQLEGNEEALGNENHRVTLEWCRNAVAIPKDQEHYSEFSLREAARSMLRKWAKNKLREDIITAMHSVQGVDYTAASALQLNTWHDDNADRVLYGDAVANFTPGDHAASLGNITAGMVLNAAAVSRMKELSKETTTTDIHPMDVENELGREYYVLFVNSRQFRDLKNDAVMQQANREARPRDVDSNPIFQDGDLIYDGVIIKEIPEMAGTIQAGAGSGGIDVGPAFFCGAGAVAIAWGQTTKTTAEVRDYNFIRGVGIEEARGVSKILNGVKDNGMLTGHFAAVAGA